MDSNSPRAVYAHVIIKLLQGPVYMDDKNVWRDLTVLGNLPFSEYVGRIGLELLINETDGFARIIQPETDEHDENPLPRLMQKANNEL